MKFWLEILIWLLVFGGQSFFYLKIASKYQIVDIPNERSSHSNQTIRGGGIIIWTAILVAFKISDINYQYFFIGMALIGFLSFWDDVKPLSPTFRLIFHIVAVVLLCISVWPLSSNYLFWLSVIIVLATVNSYNFMDGINGLSGWYTLLGVITVMLFGHHNMFYWSPILAALLVFIFLNSRPKGHAVLFGGDVGSVVCGYFLIFWVLKFIVASGQISYILILAVYGLDSGWTILLRLYRRENLLKAHRKHLYQFLVNQKGIPHLRVTGYYVLLQIVINSALFIQLKYNYFNDLSYFLANFLILSFIYHYLLNFSKKQKPAI